MGLGVAACAVRSANRQACASWIHGMASRAVQVPMAPLEGKARLRRVVERRLQSSERSGRMAGRTIGQAREALGDLGGEIRVRLDGPGRLEHTSMWIRMAQRTRGVRPSVQRDEPL